jgi:NAD(P)-dependent dehydrogenase (short-subunit alcohol dehydrogenase family)
MKVDLTGKIAVVTGAASGIGQACARILLENNAKVVVADVQKEAGEKTATELSATGICRFIHTDVTLRKSVEEMVGRVIEEFGGIDIFVNNAGINIGGKRVNIDEYSDENWDKVLAVDLTGVFYCSQAVSRVMIKRQSGKIINIGSVFGAVPARKQIAFTAAKGGLHNMTRAMALELAPSGIRVNAIAPGSILTEGTRQLFYGNDADQAEMTQQMLSHVPLGQPGEVDDIAYAVLFLASPQSNYITGHILTVDGGWTCGYTRDF